MNLNPNENEYIGRLKDMMEYCLADSCVNTIYAEFVKDLNLNSAEEEILSLHFFSPFDLNLSSLDNDDQKNLENLLYKFVRSELKNDAKRKKIIR
ncbi:hypothetical protein HON71_04355 [Candidatus Woesearchaeota archaeon]|nr:hypothetical protein [Candidatus Woesearchaeota archaeon]